MADEYSITWLYYILCIILSSGDEHLGCFYFLIIMNNEALNILVQVFMWAYGFNSLGYLPRTRIAGSCGNSVFNFWGMIKLFFYSGCISLHSYWRLQLFHIFLLYILIIWLLSRISLTLTKQKINLTKFNANCFFDMSKPWYTEYFFPE